MDEKDQRKIYLRGIAYTVAAFTAWGILPLYWKALKQVPAGEILAHRIFWSFVFAAAALFIYGRRHEFISMLSIRPNRVYALVCAGLISANWFTYIWAVNAGHVVEASLGYYINPLFSVFLGVVVLKEKLNFWQVCSILLAAAGVAVITVTYGRIPWIALILTLTFGTYGLIKKVADIESLMGLTLETVVIAPAALGYIIFKQAAGTGNLGYSLSLAALLVFSGIVTGLPLLWFAKGAQVVPLSTVGLTQYLAPTITLFLGVFVFREPFTVVEAISFGLIWVALLIYSLSGMKWMYRLQPRLFKKAGM
ncbi:EamA family transporter RarD [Phosphitispora fastidiosa]|uniref:EamA family transporter RarD n=1 Tax=Phosphitispora fastidiosa TaxID=2837202 RepID=UPI001E53A120|nr:EamA family transporter RarD [Phosphitispora fastidiosa]MBU7005905.1 chloramphenicol-sensitive protein RarD [Phosphitispora fastidiosa]